MEQKEVVKFDDSFSEENLDIKEETILNPALKGEGGRNVKTTSYF